MITNANDVLKRLNLEDSGRYDNHFYVIDLEDSNDYARVYSTLCDVAVNTEYPGFGKNSTNNTVKITTYFKLDVNNISYNLFLIADFEKDKYYLKIGEDIVGSRV